MSDSDITLIQALLAVIASHTAEGFSVVLWAVISAIFGMQLLLILYKERLKKRAANNGE